MTIHTRNNQKIARFAKNFPVKYLAISEHIYRKYTLNDCRVVWQALPCGLRVLRCVDNAAMEMFFFLEAGKIPQ